MDGSARREWGRLCPELWGAGRAPALGDEGSLRPLPDLNFLLLFMALCCFSVPQLLPVSFQPQCCPLHLKPLSGRSPGELPACCLWPGAPLSSGPADGGCPARRKAREGGRGADTAPPGELCPALAGEGLRHLCPSLLPSLTLSLTCSWRSARHAGSCWPCGWGEPLRHRLEPRQAGSERQTQQKECVSLSCGCPAFPDKWVWGTRRWDVCVLAPVPLERLRLQAGQPLLLLATLMLLRLYFKIKNSSYHAGGLLYSSSSEPGPTLLHPMGLSQTALLPHL